MPPKCKTLLHFLKPLLPERVKGLPAAYRQSPGALRRQILSRLLERLGEGNFLEAHLSPPAADGSSVSGDATVELWLRCRNHQAINNQPKPHGYTHCSVEEAWD
jgi:hypothetical protein